MEDATDRLTTATESERSQPVTKIKSILWEVQTRNRVIKLKTRKPIKGRQGEWHFENILVAAENKDKADSLVRDYLKKRTIIGKPLHRQQEYKREVEIHEIWRKG